MCSRCGNRNYPKAVDDFYPNCSQCETCLACRGTGIAVEAVGNKSCDFAVCKGRGWWRKEEKKQYDLEQARKKQREAKGVR